MRREKKGRSNWGKMARTESSERWVPWIGQCRWPEGGNVRVHRIKLLSSRTLTTRILRKPLPTFHQVSSQFAEAQTSFTLQVAWLELNLSRLLHDIMDVFWFICEERPPWSQRGTLLVSFCRDYGKQHTQKKLSNDNPYVGINSKGTLAELSDW
jgi:hypothetical protein